ncbi:MAG: hypothetical protein QXF26_10255 [Candidatus Bathyarchaeia archaeon]
MGEGKKDQKSREIVGVIGVALAIGLILANANSIYGLLSSVFSVGTTGIVKSANIKVYRESACINEISSIDWGFLDPGASKSVTIYVNNTGNVPLTLTQETQRWNPSSASTYMTLTWDYAGTKIQPNQVIAIALTLDVSETIQNITSFSFDLVITGTETT